ncbi:H13 protein [Salpingoeca rosetta]|uniref:H13 protein n=1 Tax=Salpingoeca rosetta (strain ATCC 50818 / BSB-021) TaxID=946362 RepID=F2UR58_SALR5|nr:H13 protein [Salpingoeca rosetta]EGD80113.1 H13 protein [Salpingoeca rosetta]|eukprot:XP_004988438.1 H13 protein [Salpingoeca rosetta]
MDAITSTMRSRAVTRAVAGGLLLLLAAFCFASAAGGDSAATVDATTTPDATKLPVPDNADTDNGAGDADASKAQTGFLTATLLTDVALLIMAITPIYFGAWESISAIQFEFVQAAEMKREADTLSQSDVLQFPIYASCMLVGLYALIKLIGPEYVNMLLTAYITILGVAAVIRVFARVLTAVLPARLLGHPYHLTLIHEHPEAGPTSEPMLDVKFTNAHVAAIPLALALSVFYLITKHWVANNVFALSFAVTGIEFMPLNNFKIAAILLGGLFIYDIFWVFGTDVMVTVAKSLDAPIKIVFPRDFMEKFFGGQQHAILGLGDIVLPGAVLAFLLRFDQSRKPGSCLYFLATYIAYILGLVATYIVMHVFHAAQPALLYLSPACIGAPVLLALARGEFNQLLSYSDEGAFTPAGADSKTGSEKKKE